MKFGIIGSGGSWGTALAKNALADNGQSFTGGC
jgi:glycerol-3-phosphate dehydrogenase